MTTVLDSGALIAIDKDDRKFVAMLRVLQRDGVPVRTSVGAIAQVWRDGRRQASLARILPGVDIAPLDDVAARRIGELLRTNRSDDLVDAHVALLTPAGGTVLTSDERGLRSLLRTRRVKATIVPV